MEQKSFMERIKSKITLNYIFSYISEKKKYQLIMHRKKLQNILNINLQRYKTQSFRLCKDFDFLRFLSTDNLDINALNIEDYKNILKTKYEEELKNHNLEKGKYRKLIDEYFENYCNEIYNNNKNKEEINDNIFDNNLKIDIYSPFYEMLTKKEIFEKLFVIKIPLNLIFKHKLMDDYSNAINVLNKIRPNFSSFYFEVNDLSDEKQLYVKRFIESLTALKKVIFKFPREINLYKSLNDIFELSKIKNNLLYLEIKSDLGQFIEGNKFETVFDQLTNLEELRLDNAPSFEFRKNNIKYLYLSNCYSVRFTENCYPNLRIIGFYEVGIFNESSNQINESKIKFPELIKFKASYSYQKYSDIFDFNSFRKLKYFKRIILHDFFKLGETLLEKVYINNAFIDSKEKEIKMFQKIMEIKTLKELKIGLLFLSEDNIKQIKGENTNLEKLIISSITPGLQKDSSEINVELYDIQNKFPNLKEFQLYMNNKIYRNNRAFTLDISENNNSKINSFKFSGNKNSFTIKFYTGPFNQLVNVEFSCITPSLFNFEKSFPLFAKKCDYIFKSLKSFKLVTTPNYSDYYEEMDSIEIKNFIDNLDKMPNLQILQIQTLCDINKKEYMILIDKLLSSNIKKIEFEIFEGEDYSKNELKSLYKNKNIDIEKFDKIKIKKLI